MICYIAYPTSLMLASANALQTYTTLRELRVRRPDTLALLPRWGREPSRFAEVGARHLLRPAIGKLSRLHRSTLLYYLEHSAFALMTAAVVARQREVEAVYVRQVVLAAWWAGVFGPRLGLPVVYEAHDLESRNPSRAKEPWAQGVVQLMDRVALTRATAVVSLTEDFRHLLAALGWRHPAEVFVVPDAYDEYLFAPGDRAAARLALGLPPTAPIIAYAGMTFSHRWLDGLLAATARLAPQWPGLRLLLVGGREREASELRERAEALGMRVVWGTLRVEQGATTGAAPATVHFVPPQPQAAVARYLNAADVFAIPDTVTDVTASPLKLFEYLALGQPLVLPALPALHEIVPAALCYPFARRDLAGLTAALAAALAAAPDASGTQARRALASAHTYGRRAERILALVDRIADSR